MLAQILSNARIHWVPWMTESHDHMKSEPDREEALFQAGAELTGVAPMFYITFKKDAAETHRKRRDDFYTHLIRKGIFLHPHHHGYISYRHTDQDLDSAAKAIDEALAYVKEKHQK